MPLFSAVAPLPINQKPRRMFNPSKIADMVGWWDASDWDTLFDSTTGGNYVTTNGSAVKRLDDKSGNGRHFIESTSAPTLSIGEKNNRNSLNFATGKYLTAAISGITFTAQTIFTVFKFNDPRVAFGRVFTQQQTGSNDFSGTSHYIPILLNSSVNGIVSYAGDGARSNVSATVPNWYIARARHSGSSLTVKLNATEGASFSHTLNRVFNNFRLGATISSTLGIDGSVLSSFISECIVYSRSLTDLESDQVTSYLNSKYAIY